MKKGAVEQLDFDCLSHGGIIQGTVTMCFEAVSLYVYEFCVMKYIFLLFSNFVLNILDNLIIK